MARQARIKNDYGLFHIYQSGGADRKLFTNDTDREFFLSILKRAQGQFNFKLYAYCLLSDNDYQLVLDANGSDVSKIMKSINIGYAMHIKHHGPLFKDRYKSQLLSNENELNHEINKVHEKARNSHNTWNSFCTYDKTQPIILDWITPLDQLNGQDSIGPQKAICVDCIKSLEAAQQHLEALAANSHQTPTQLIKDKLCRNRLIHDFRQNTTLSLKELGILFGGLSESTICKILKQD